MYISELSRSLSSANTHIINITYFFKFKTSSYDSNCYYILFGKCAVTERLHALYSLRRYCMKKLKTKKSARIVIIIAAAVLCLAAVSIAVCCGSGGETPLSLERSSVSKIHFEGDSQSRNLTETEVDEFVRRFNLFDVNRQNKKCFSVQSDLVLLGVPATYTVSFNDGTKLTVASFAEGVYNLGGEIKERFGKTVCSAAGVVKNTDAYKEHNGMLLG